MGASRIGLLFAIIHTNLRDVPVVARVGVGGAPVKEALTGRLDNGIWVRVLG